MHMCIYPKSQDSLSQIQDSARVLSYFSHNASSRVGTTTSKRSNTIDPPPTTSSMGMYERSMLQLKIREQKLKYIEKDMMKDCTFAPKLNVDSRKVNKAHVSNRVRDHDIRKVTSRKSKGIYQPSTSVPPCTTTSTTTSTSPRTASTATTSTPGRSPMSVDTNSTGSVRIDKLYQDGLKKAQSRTDREEEHARRERFEELNMRQCTFQPRTRWTASDVQSMSPTIKDVSFHATKTPPRKETIAPAASLFKQDDAKSKMARTPESWHKKHFFTTSKTSPYCYYDSPPLRMVETSTAESSTSTPMGSVISSPSMIVSPLREPSMSLVSRRDLDKTTINTRGGSSIGSETEYGSI